jgi:hypothetical protein
VSLRRRVALELATLAVLTPVFLVLVSERPVWVDAGLGLVAVAARDGDARTTREQVWAPLESLPAMHRENRAIDARIVHELRMLASMRWIASTSVGRHGQRWTQHIRAAPDYLANGW